MVRNSAFEDNIYQKYLAMENSNTSFSVIIPLPQFLVNFFWMKNTDKQTSDAHARRVDYRDTLSTMILLFVMYR